MILTETSPAPVAPVSSADFTAHLRLAQGFVGDPGEDALLDLYLRNAAAVIEARTGKALIRRGYKLTVSAWNRAGHLILPIGPVASIDSIALAKGAATITVPDLGWVLEPGRERQRLTGQNGGPLPAIPVGYTAELSFVAGLGDTPADLPGELVQAVVLLAAHYYENRYGDADPKHGLPKPVLALIEGQLPVRL